MTFLNYETLEQTGENRDEVEGFPAAKKIRFTDTIILDGEKLGEAIIAHGTGFGSLSAGLFTYKNPLYADTDEKEWVLEFEAMNERTLLIRLADLSENLELKTAAAEN